MKIIRRKQKIDLIQVMIIAQIISPLLYYYEIPFTDIALPTAINTLTVVVILFGILLRKKIGIEKKSYKSAIMAFMAWIVIQTVVLHFLAKYDVELNMSFFNAIFVLIIVMCLPEYVERKRSVYVKVYATTSALCIFLFLINLFGDRLFYKHFNLSIPFLDLQKVYISSFKNWSVGLFSEAAHLAQYVVPMIIIYLFDNSSTNHKKQIYKAIGITLVCVMSLSGNGIVCCAIIWLLYFFTKAKKGNTQGLIYVIYGFVFFVVAALIISRIPSLVNVINRLFIDRTGSSYSYTKADYRIYRGFDYFFQLPLINKIAGIGYKALTSFAPYAGLSSRYDNYQLFEYLNAICQTLIYHGIAGFLLYATSIIRHIKGRGETAKIIGVVFLALSISSSVYLDSTMILFFIIIAAIKEKSLDIIGNVQ